MAERGAACLDARGSQERARALPSVLPAVTGRIDEGAGLHGRSRQRSMRGREAVGSDAVELLRNWQLLDCAGAGGLSHSGSESLPWSGIILGKAPSWRHDREARAHGYAADGDATDGSLLPSLLGEIEVWEHRVSTNFHAIYEITPELITATAIKTPPS